MNLNEHKGIAFGGLVAIIAIIANIAQILDWLGIKPKEKQTPDTSSSVIEVAIPETIEETAPPETEAPTEKPTEKPTEPPETEPPKPKTIKLTSLDYFATSHNSDFKIETMNDNIGNSHTSFISFWTTDGFVQYYLNSKYLEFSGQIFLTDKWKSLDEESYVEILADGNTLATFVMIAGVLPQDFLLDVTDVQILEIHYSEKFKSSFHGDAVGIDATLTERPQ